MQFESQTFYLVYTKKSSVVPFSINLAYYWRGKNLPSAVTKIFEILCVFKILVSQNQGGG